MIVSLTRVGENMASHPIAHPSDAMQVLSYLRKSGYSASDEKLIAHFGINKRTLNDIVQKLLNEDAVTVSGGG